MARGFQDRGDLLGGELDDLPVPWDGGALSCLRVEIDSVAAPLTEELATVSLEVTDQVLSFHYAGKTNGSRMTSSPTIDSSAISRLASRISWTASTRFARGFLESFSLCIGARQSLYKGRVSLGKSLKNGCQLHPSPPLPILLHCSWVRKWGSLFQPLSSSRVVRCGMASKSIRSGLLVRPQWGGFRPVRETAPHRLCEAAIAFGYKKNIPDFKRPDGRNHRFAVFEAIQDSEGTLIGFVLEAPGHHHRIVNDEPSRFQRRPSSIISRIDRPPRRCPARNSLSSAMISTAGFFREGLAYPKVATGTPCFSIVIRSPLATRSRSLDRCVLASKAPTVGMKRILQAPPITRCSDRFAPVRRKPRSASAW